MKKSVKSICGFILFCSFGMSQASSPPSQFNDLKDEIDRLENLIIQDFIVKIPKNYVMEYSLQKHIETAQKIEVQYGIQKNLFYKLESELYKIKTSLRSKVKSKLITEEEHDKLLNRVEYASRIILRSRKAEVNQLYSKAIGSMSHIPKIEDLFDKFQKIDSKFCKIEKLKYDSQSQKISFEVQESQPLGNKKITTFEISQKDLIPGFISSRYDKSFKYGPEKKIITHYSSNEGSNGVFRFTLLENMHGEVKKVFFSQEEIPAPYFSVFGVGFGKTKKKSIFNCNKKAGPKPASISF